MVKRPFADLDRPSDLDSVQWPDPYDPGRVAGVREEAKRLFEETDFAIVADIMCLGPFEGACFMRGYEQFCMDLYWNRDMAHAILDKITQTDIQLWDLFLQQVEPYVQVVAQGDDLGTQKATWIKPEMFQADVKPYLKELYDFIHGQTDAKVFMHSCGSVFDLIPDLIDCGVQALNPIQRSAAKMDIAEMKRQFGSELAFWGGGIDVQQVLPRATHDEIRREVDYSIETLGRGGGLRLLCRPQPAARHHAGPHRGHVSGGAGSRSRSCMTTLIGLDVGTTGCKAVVFDADGSLLRERQSRVPRGPASPHVGGAGHRGRLGVRAGVDVGGHRRRRRGRGGGHRALGPR